MATDKSEPRVGLILKVGILSIACLVAAHAGLVAYFDAVAHAEEQRKFGEIKPEALMSLRQDESQRLTAGPVPIEKAMQEVARGRMSTPGVVPEPSKDTAPLQGWIKMPGEVPLAMTMAFEDAGAAPQVVSDAGASMTDAAPPKSSKSEQRRADGGAKASKRP